jgi:hypothetical protein
VLWIAALVLVPLPMLQFGAEVPVVRYLILTGLTLALVVAEGAGWVATALVLLFLGHALVYAALLWVVAWAVARALHAWVPRRAGAVALGLAALGLFGALLTRPYVTPFSSVSLRSNLPVVFQ